MANPHLCQICGKGKGGTSHKECSKILQARHLEQRRKKPAQKLLVPGQLEFLSKTGS